MIQCLEEGEECSRGGGGNGGGGGGGTRGEQSKARGWLQKGKIDRREWGKGEGGLLERRLISS